VTFRAAPVTGSRVASSNGAPQGLRLTYLSSNPPRSSTGSCDTAVGREGRPQTLDASFEYVTATGPASGLPSPLRTRPDTTAPGSSIKDTIGTSLAAGPKRPRRSARPSVDRRPGRWFPSGRASVANTVRPESWRRAESTAFAGIE
jgi:hypothetical protein